MEAVVQVPLCNATIVFFARGLLVDISKFREHLSQGEFSEAVLSPGGQLLKQCRRFSIKDSLAVLSVSEVTGCRGSSSSQLSYFTLYSPIGYTGDVATYVV